MFMRSQHRVRRLLAFALLVAGCQHASPRTPSQDSVRADRKNIVFIYGDDHSERAIGCYGSTMNATPHIDRLAAGGMRFTQSFVANSICGPARATILTGLHSHANGKTTNAGGFRTDLPTFAKSLQNAGYQTAMVGKWHFATPPEGFDYWRWAQGTYYGTDFKTADGVLKNEGYCTDLITDDALRWLQSERDEERPFMIWISHKAAHRTWEPAQDTLLNYDGVQIPEPTSLFDDYAGRSPGAASAQMRISKDLFPAYDLKLPITGEGILDDAAARNRGRMTVAERKAWDAAYDPRNAAFAAANLAGDALVRWKYQRYIKDYLRCVDALDASIGRVLDWLEEAGLEEDTIVVYSSDQGFFLGEHGWYDKRWMYEPALRTPLIVRWPGVTQADTTCASMVQNIDMAPTFLAMAGVAEPDGMHGRSLAPLLGGGQPGDWRDAIYYHYQQRDSGRIEHMVEPHYGVRTARYKLMYVYDLGEWELYDLQEDPDELRNVVDDEGYAEVRESLGVRLRELRAEFGDETGKSS
jgi:arylsulfatase A-like enzyme